MKKLIRNIVIKNWGLKLLSLILAFFIWLSLIPEEKTFSEKTLTVPLEIVNVPPDMELLEKPEAAVEVIIRAPNRLINEITAANVIAKLNLQQASVFQREFPLKEAMISVPPGAAVVRISPNQVRLKLERTKEVMLEIVPNIIGQVKEEHGISKVEVMPTRVAVKGPESKVKEKDRVTTVPINVSDLTKSTEFDADLILPNPYLRLTYPRSKVRVRILIEGPGSAEKPAPKKKQ